MPAAAFRHVATRMSTKWTNHADAFTRWLCAATARQDDEAYQRESERDRGRLGGPVQADASRQIVAVCLCVDVSCCFFL